MSNDETAAPADAVEDAERLVVVPHGSQAGGHRSRTILMAGLAYLALSVLVWWNLWSGHPTSTTTCECGDPSLFTWFLDWPAHAISHGLNPLYSKAMGFPHGVNLLANTSEVAIGLALAPITWIFGPVATLNVAVTLSPALSGLAMFVLLSRWVTWMPAAFIGGIFYGFSPLVLTNLTDAHLMVGMAAVPPLIVACLDEILVRQRARPVVTGVVLGLLVTLQFFISTEVLLMSAVLGTIGVVLLVVYAAWTDLEDLRRRARRALVGLGAGAATIMVILAYPLWFALDGPAHLSGPIWLGLVDPSTSGTTVANFLVAEPASSVRAQLGITSFGLSPRLGGYPGTILSAQYFGLGVVAVTTGGLAIWRRDRRLWFFAALAVASGVLSLGVEKNVPLPWQAVSSLPLFENVIPSRFVLFTYLAVAVMLGLVVDHTRAAVNGRRAQGTGPAGGRPGGSWARLPLWSGSAAGLLVGAIALVPPATYLAQNLPIATEPVTSPTWFTSVAPHLKGHQVLLVFPYSGMQSAMMWQAVDGMGYSMVDEWGPGGTALRAGKEFYGDLVLSDFSSTAGGEPPAITRDDVLVVHQALRAWGVSMVVIPDGPNLPPDSRISSAPSAAALISAATGTPPVHQGGAWVWSGVGSDRSPAVATTSVLERCTTGLGSLESAAVAEATACVLADTGSGPTGERHDVS